MKNAISRRNGDEILSEFREHVQNVQIRREFQKVCEILRKIREISGIDREIQSIIQFIQSSP